MEIFHSCDLVPRRNNFLGGALQLGKGLSRGFLFNLTASMAQAMPLINLFQFLAVRLNGEKEERKYLNDNIKY